MKRYYWFEKNNILIPHPTLFLFLESTWSKVGVKLFQPYWVEWNSNVILCDIPFGFFFSAFSKKKLAVWYDPQSIWIINITNIIIFIIIKLINLYWFLHKSTPNVFFIYQLIITCYFSNNKKFYASIHKIFALARAKFFCLF